MRVKNRLFMLYVGHDFCRDLPASIGFALLPKRRDAGHYELPWTFLWSFHIAWEWFPRVNWRGSARCGRG